MKYFVDNFAALNLKKIIATGLNSGFLIMTADGIKIGELEGNGDFRTQECIDILREADIVVTNQPFSLFREYVAQIFAYQKKFVILGNINSLTYKEIFPLIKENKIWLGYGMGRKISGFMVPKYYELYGTEAGIDADGKRIVATNQCLWYTNIPLRKYKEELLLTLEYSPELYPRYDNYDAIEVSKTVRIPCDYFGVMGVPITFLDKYNPDQFEIIATGGGIIAGRRTYKRLLIRRRV